MQLSHNGVQALKQFEGLRLQAYKDTGGVWTIGYGSITMFGKPVTEGLVCTEADAEKQKTMDLAWAQTAVNKLVRVPLTQNQFDALVSFVYNVGETAFSRSTLLKVLNQRNFAEAVKQFLRWVYDNGKFVIGLENRRKKEAELFSS